LVDHPLAVDLLGHAQRAGVEPGDDFLDRVTDFGRSGGGGEVGARLEGVVDDLLQCGHWGFPFLFVYRERHSAAMRSAPSMHSAVSATSAIRMKPAPRLMPQDSRARKLPGRTVTLYSATSRRANSVSDTGVRAHR